MPLLNGENADKETKMDIGPTELIIILVIVVLLFGVGRIGKISGEMGSAIRQFREGFSGPKAETAQPPEPGEQKGQTS